MLADAPRGVACPLAGDFKTVGIRSAYRPDHERIAILSGSADGITN